MFSSNFQYHITLLGEPQVGKTCILNQLVRKIFVPKYKPTLETDMEYIHEYNGRTYVCLIVDTAGHREFPAMRRLSITRSNGFLVVFDMTSIESFEKAMQTCQEITSHKVREFINIILVGNKRDLALQQNNNETNNRLTQQATEVVQKFNQDPYIQCRFAKVTASETEEVKALYEQLLDMLDTIHLTKGSHHLTNVYQARNIRARRNNNNNNKLGGNVNTGSMHKTHLSPHIPPSPTTNLLDGRLSKSTCSLASVSSDIDFIDVEAEEQLPEGSENWKRHSLPHMNLTLKEKRQSLPFWKSPSPRTRLNFLNISPRAEKRNQKAGM